MSFDPGILPKGKTIVAGVMGWPVSHSRSPRLHGYWLREYDIDGVYLPFAVKPGDFSSALKSLGNFGIRGVNVTVPHKEQAFVLADEVDDFARRVGAVNTIRLGADGRLIASNTDGFGFIENLKAGAPDWRGDGGPAVVLGAGGAARGVIAALVDEGVSDIRLLNRSRDRAEVLANSPDMGNIQVIDWEQRSEALAGANLLVNTTSLGMKGADPLVIRLDELPPSATVTDIVYTPLQTDLLAQALRRGNRIVDGLGMLLHQARPGFEAWFGVKPEVTPALRAFVLKD